ncbi:uncharacterized protein FIBRA_05629 [Fibroporia radiculosa]|uniref:G-protein coupled receptors family 1 profile domain-containing protein n=1 Tax=Fibroporia radiculosa TaxID=599839 RepID=J4GRC9_9APHY|nr:uncharacterized protein FIBRA_05629 [Fibroporia radiculosa]CCM03495.1 predicted protein [Fibroporia radiculosa]
MPGGDLRHRPTLIRPSTSTACSATLSSPRTFSAAQLQASRVLFCVLTVSVVLDEHPTRSQLFSMIFHDKRVTAQQLGPHASSDLNVWLFFQVAANHILLPVLVLTFLFSRAVARHLAIINVCCTWIVSGVICSLLLYVGSEKGAQPNQGLCVAQSALPGRIGLKTVLLVFPPYVLLGVFAAIGANLSAQDPDQVSREYRFFYCSLDLAPFASAIAIFSASVCVIATILYAHVLLGIWHNRQATRVVFPTQSHDLQLIIRVGLFVLYMLAASVVNLMLLGNPASAFPDIFIASVGMAVFVIFASQPDVVRVWWFRRRRNMRQRPHMASPPLPRTPLPSFDMDLMRRTESEVSEKARLEALHAYYSARVRGEGVNVEIIDRPENAFIPNRHRQSRSSVSRKASTESLMSSGGLI